jgi:hypothetical protein
VTEDQANAVWDVLVAHAGASDDPDSALGRRIFVLYMTGGHPPDEFRFIGRLGFGGKFWVGGRDGWYVTAYPEDMRRRPEIGQAVEATNDALAELQARMVA